MVAGGKRWLMLLFVSNCGCWWCLVVAGDRWVPAVAIITVLSVVVVLDGDSDRW